MNLILVAGKKCRDPKKIKSPKSPLRRGLLIFFLAFSRFRQPVFFVKWHSKCSNGTFKVTKKVMSDCGKKVSFLIYLYTFRTRYFTSSLLWFTELKKIACNILQKKVGLLLSFFLRIRKHNDNYHNEFFHAWINWN